MRGEANPAGGQRKPPSTDAEKQAAAQQFMQAARSGRMNMFGGGKKGLAQPQEGGQTAQPTGRNMMGSGPLGRAAGQLFSRPEVQAQMKARGTPTPGTEMGHMSGNRAMGVLNRATREGMAKNAPASAADRAGGMKKGGSVSASKRADGCVQRGKTKGRMV